MLKSLTIIFFTCLTLSSASQVLDNNISEEQAAVAIDHFYNLFKEDKLLFEQSLDFIETTWREEYITILLDIAYITNSQSIANECLRILREKTGKKYFKNMFKWQDWLWAQEQKIIPLYADWLALIYQNIDPKFDTYFRGRTNQALIRLDEVKWGGVVQDGIPPLRSPKMLSAKDADYLGDNNIVFGIIINGDARAYPKRILAWHEMFVDVIGGESVAGVYCTLCGTVIAYNTKYKDTNHQLGTSGFLYRSNKLMYDETTQSLWNTIEGKPVIGPLVDKNIELSTHSVVTTTWKEWKKRHPKTKVLSMNTGHRRNYDEGAAYRSYFSTDKLMFNVPSHDKRLKNKAEVLVIRAPDYTTDPLAISTDFLKKRKVYNGKVANTHFVVITDQTGANRVYESKENIFKEWKDDAIINKNGESWSITENYLKSNDDRKLNRIPSHRIFWFAWINTYQNTRLIK